MNPDYVTLIINQLEQSGQLNSVVNHPSVQKILAQNQPVGQKYVINDLSEDEVVFMKAYRAFLSDKQGNKYVGMASNFAKYLQSLVDKDKAEQQALANPTRGEVVTN